MRDLRAGKHVLVEKPMTTTSKQAIELIEQADKYKRVLAVDHTFVYTGAVRKIQELVASDALGDIYYYDSVRINLGLFQHDVNVIWDLAVHDLAIMDYTMKIRPRAVSAIGVSHIPGKPEDVAYLTLFFEGPLIAHIHINWLSPVKIRRTIIGGSSKMVIYDDLEPSEKIKIYDSGITVSNDDENRHNLLIGYRTGDMLAPQLKLTEALSVEAQHFIRCIEEGEKPLIDGKAGLRVVRMLEAANESMAQYGKVVELNIKG
jgi:predicted dehydrogenase